MKCYCLMHKPQAILITVLLILATPSLAEKEPFQLDNKVNKTIKSACQGYLPDLLPDSLAWLRKEIYDGSSVCEKAKSENTEELRTHIRAIRRNYPIQLDRSKKDGTSEQIAFECNNEYMCIETRTRLHREKQPISQADYTKVSQHCDGRYSCISSFFIDWPKPLPQAHKETIETTPSYKSNSKPLSLAGLMNKQASQQPKIHNAPTSNKISLGNVLAERHRVDIEKLRSDIIERQGRIHKLCDCVMANYQCYKHSLKSRHNSVESITSQKTASCNGFSRNELAGSLPTDKATAEKLIRALETRESTIKKIDKKARAAIKQARQDEEYELARQEKQNSFQWGKFAAMGVGALAGGLGEMDGNTQTEFLGAMVRDSMGGVDGMRNTMNYTNQKTSSLRNNSNTAFDRTTSNNSSGPFSFACTNSTNDICMEYTFNNKQEYLNTKRQCGKVIARCNISGPACTTKTSTATQLNIILGADPDKTKQVCEANGGVYSSPQTSSYKAPRNTTNQASTPSINSASQATGNKKGCFGYSKVGDCSER